MAIIQTVDLHTFREAFRAYGRQDQFSREAFEALFNYLEQYSEDTGDFDLDVVAICCDWTESHWSDIANDYCLDWVENCETDEEKAEAVRDYLNDNTIMLELSDGETFVYMAF